MVVVDGHTMNLPMGRFVVVLIIQNVQEFLLGMKLENGLKKKRKSCRRRSANVIVAILQNQAIDLLMGIVFLKVERRENQDQED